MVLPPLRYGEVPNEDMTLLARLAEVMADAFPKSALSRPAWKELRAEFEATDLERATRNFVETATELCRAQRADQASLAASAPLDDQGPTLLLSIDQFEELL